FGDDWIQFQVNDPFAHFLSGNNETAANISVFNQNRPERYTRSFGKSYSRRYTGIRHANYDVCLNRCLLPNFFTGALTYFMYVDVLQQGIGSGKINIFECTDPVFAVF